MVVARNIGYEVVTKQGVKPQNFSGSNTVNGSSVGRTGYLSAVLIGQAGSATGSPTSQSHTVKLQQSTDGGSSWSDISGASLTLDGNDQAKEVDVDLSAEGADIRAVVSSSFSGGSSPANDLSAVIVLGGADELPA